MWPFKRKLLDKKKQTALLEEAKKYLQRCSNSLPLVPIAKEYSTEGPQLLKISLEYTLATRQIIKKINDEFLLRNIDTIIRRIEKSLMKEPYRQDFLDEIKKLIRELIIEIDKKINKLKSY